MAELLIRAAMNDHLVVSDLLAPAAGPHIVPRRPPIARLVADAHVAASRPSLSDAARGAGIPFLVDPDTPFLQSEVASGDRWAQLPFGRAESVAPGEVDVARLVAEVVEFQLDHGATAIIPPYFYAPSPADPWFVLSLRMVDETAAYLSDNNVRLPLLPILCARLLSFGDHTLWPAGIDRFTERAKATGSSTIALCLSPAGDAKDGYGKVRRLFDTAQRAKAARGLRVFAWRQGVYGLGLTAAGLAGYECGIGTAERTDIAGQQSARRPRAHGRHAGGGAPGIFIETLGRSVPRRVGEFLFGNMAMRPKVMCDDVGCCSSVAATLDKPREHAVRSRARLLEAIAEQPSRRWRLNHVAREASQAATLAAQANRVLEAEGEAARISTRAIEALSQVASELAQAAQPGRIA